MSWGSGCSERGFLAHCFGRGFDRANDVSNQIAEAVFDPFSVDMDRPAQADGVSEVFGDIIPHRQQMAAQDFGSGFEVFGVGHKARVKLVWGSLSSRSISSRWLAVI
jgi:hypothetical protein